MAEIRHDSCSEYLCPASPLDVEITIKRSRFIASIRKAMDRSAFEAQYADIVACYPRATHYCWAYRTDFPKMVEHSSDAGEPSGTAGRPILGVIKKHGLQNTMIVVTRYFGGIKLGVRGLITAYGDAAEQAVLSSNIVTDILRSKLRFTIPYDMNGVVQSILSSCGVDRDDIVFDYAECITAAGDVPQASVAALKEAFAGIYDPTGVFTYSIEEP